MNTIGIETHRYAPELNKLHIMKANGFTLEMPVEGITDIKEAEDFVKNLPYRVKAKNYRFTDGVAHTSYWNGLETNRGEILDVKICQDGLVRYKCDDEYYLNDEIEVL